MMEPTPEKNGTNAHPHQAGELKPVLGRGALINIGIGAVIGAGIFVLTGIAAAQHAGPALTLSFVIAALGCSFAALCYAEFAAMLPTSGSVYSYARHALGEPIAWFVGWNLVLEYLFGAATVSVGWSGYINSLFQQFHINLPSLLSQAPLKKGDGPLGLEFTGSLINLPAVLIIIAVTAICIVGTNHSSRVNNFFVVIKVAIVILFIAVGVFYIDPQNWHPFIPENSGKFGEFGWSGIAQAAGIVFYTYIGFDAVSTAAGEAKNPQRDMPIGILGSLIICSTLYIAVSAVLTGLVPYHLLNVPAPVAVALDAHPQLAWFSALIKVGAIAGMTSVILVFIFGQARIFFAMAQDGMVPSTFSRVHRRYRTPYISTLVTGSVAALIAGLFPINILGELVAIGTLLAFVAVCIGVWVLRYTQPEIKRPFKVPAVHFCCAAGVLLCGGMAASLPVDTWWRLLIWSAIGMGVYFFYGQRHSVFRKARKQGSANQATITEAP